MISEESCHTEDWSNDGENVAIIEIIYILKYIELNNLLFLFILIHSLFSPNLFLNGIL